MFGFTTFHPTFCRWRTTYVAQASPHGSGKVVDIKAIAVEICSQDDCVLFEVRIDIKAGDRVLGNQFKVC
ncbi:hypothetical protein [Anabaena sp. CCY 0017]|uniref:hypothetical protein n=1 Tax=Anabaena sp. CCY 0017 TaxID=3103866 RepID=UPI0039C73311